MTDNVIRFPERRHRRSLGVRFVPSVRLPGHFEVQQFDRGVWRAISLHSTQTGAEAAAKRLVEIVILANQEYDGDVPA